MSVVSFRKTPISIERYESRRRELERLLRECDDPTLLRVMPVDTLAYWLRSSLTPAQIVEALVGQGARKGVS